jgi:hypothetical protein
MWVTADWPVREMPALAGTFEDPPALQAAIASIATSGAASFKNFTNAP